MASAHRASDWKQYIELFRPVNDEVGCLDCIGHACGIGTCSPSFCFRDDNVIGVFLNLPQFQPEVRQVSAPEIPFKKEMIPSCWELDNRVIGGTCDVDVFGSTGVYDCEEITFPAVVSFICGRFELCGSVVSCARRCIVFTDAFGLTFPIVV